MRKLRFLLDGILSLGPCINHHAPYLRVTLLALLLSEALVHQSLQELLLWDCQNLLAALEWAELIHVYLAFREFGNPISEHFIVPSNGTIFVWKEVLHGPLQGAAHFDGYDKPQSILRHLNVSDRGRHICDDHRLALLG